MSNDKDFKIKNGIQPTSYFEGVGTVTSETRGYSISSAIYDNSSYNLELQDFDPYGVALKSDGTKLYMLGRHYSSVFQYTLSAAYDISTISYDSVSFSFSSQTTGAYDFYFTSDGTKFFVLGGTSIYQYSLSTAWDISTASYDSKSFSVVTQESTPYAITLNPTGSKLCVVGAGLSVYQYTLSTPFDVSTASYDSVSLSVSSNLSFALALSFNSDGSRIFVGGTNGLLFRYNLSSAYDLSTASYSGVSADLSAQVTGLIVGLHFNSSGQKMYAVNSSGNKFVFQYSTVLNTATLDLSTGSVFDYTPTSDIQVTLSNPADSGTVSGATLLLDGGGSAGYDLGNGVYSNLFYDGSGQSLSITRGELSLDGTKLYLFNGSNLYQYTLSTAFDLTSSSYDSVSFSFTSQSASNNGFRFKADGTKLYLTSYTNQRVYQYSLSTAWDISTASYDSVSFSTSSQTTNPQDITFSSEGSIMYVTSSSTFQYSLSTAWDISTASYASKSLNHSAQIDPSGGTISSDGSKFFIVGDSLVYEYSLSTPYDISTGSYSSTSLDATGQEGAIRGIRFNPDGKTMYLTGDVEDRIYQYSTATPATITYDTAIEWPSGTAPTSPAIGETDVVTFNTRDGGSTYQGVLAIDGAK